MIQPLWITMTWITENLRRQDLFVRGDPARGIKPQTTSLRGSLGHTNPSTTIRSSGATCAVGFCAFTQKEKKQVCTTLCNALPCTVSGYTRTQNRKLCHWWNLRTACVSPAWARSPYEDFAIVLLQPEAHFRQGNQEETQLGRPPPPPPPPPPQTTIIISPSLLIRRKIHLSLMSMSTRALREILHRAGNDTCADCGAPDPDWGSTSLGVFICLACSGIHRNIPDVSKVKSLSLSHWEDHEVQFMAENGNERMKSKYEAAVPVYYYKPSHKDCQVLKEQWIRAKYERKEFTEPGNKFTYEEATRDGALMKRGRDNGQFLSRRFVLSEREGTLKYFTKYDAKEPKAVIKVDGINATFQPEKIGHPNGLQITYLKDYSTRNIFLYHDSGKEIVDWFNSIRAVQLHYMKVAFPGATDAELVPKLTRNFLKEGYMEKTGPRQTEGFKKRWFTLDQRRLMYYKDPLDAFAKGEVFLGSKEHYSASAGLPAGTYCNGAWQHGITIVTPDRCFLFTCETEAEQHDWLKLFNDIVNAQMSPQEHTMEAWFKHRH